MVSSAMTPGPLGIEETNPNAEAPHAMAACASSSEAIQQILIRGFVLTSFDFNLHPTSFDFCPRYTRWQH
jgi:hypothetical protein